MKQVTRERLAWLAVALIALMGMGLALHATRGGVGAQSDSSFYIGTAHNLVAGQGFGLTRPYTGFEFFTLFPPLYPLILAGIELSGLELVSAVRWMNALLFALTIAAAGFFILWKWRTILPACLVAILIGFSPSMLSAHAWLLSEPPYYFCGTISLLSLVIFLDHPRWHWLVLSAAAAALSALDRYAGLALAGCGVFVLLFFNPVKASLRLKRAGVFGFISLAPIAIWMWIVHLNSASIAGRELLDPADIGQRLVKLIAPLKETVIGWVPFSAELPFVSDPHLYKPFWIAMILLGTALAFLIIKTIKRGMATNGHIIGPVNLMIALTVFMGSHLLVFLVASVLLSASPAAGDRNFAPLLFSLYFLMAGSLALLLHTAKRKWLKTLIIAFSGLIIITQIAHGIQAVSAYPAEGLGYNTVSARQSQLYQSIRELPVDLLIVCNNPNIILFHTGRVAYPIVELYTDNPEWNFPVYGQGRNRTDQGQLAFEEGRAALVLLRDAYWEFQLVYGEKTDQRMLALVEGLFEYYDGYDGQIYLKDDRVLIP
ncbi:MAG: hypothetical protein JXR32_00790 [Anaerolineaceae bacterium]|nr:hypothetical protein [Anaerolineaceae bacterium]